MNRYFTLVAIGLACVLTGCGSSVTSSTQAPTNVSYSVDVTPNRLTLDVGDHSGILAVVDQSTLNSTPKPVSPPATIQFFSSDSNVSVSPGGQVCAGQWDIKFELCTAASTLPVNPVTITAYDNVHNVSGSAQVFVHKRAASITLTAPLYPTANFCVSQNQSVTYVAQAYDSTNALIPNCANSPVAGCIENLDYAWSTADSTVAGAGIYGGVVAHGPGVTSVYAKLNGTVSIPAAFATCPPAAILLETSAYNKGAPAPPFSTADMDTLEKGSTQYLTTTQFVDINGNPMTFNSLPLTFLSSDLLTGSFASLDSFTSRFTANTSGRTILSASCTPPGCNPPVAAFVSPVDNVTPVPTKDLKGFGYAIYSNVIGATITGSTGSIVLVTGGVYPNSSTPNCLSGQVCPHLMLTYDSESLLKTNEIEIANLPNSLVVAPNGTTAYVGSDEGLVVVNLGTYKSSILIYPIIGDPVVTDQITGKVLAVSPDSRYVVIADTNPASTNYQVVFLIDTTGTKAATRYAINDNIRTATFATDGYDFWIAGDSGVYVYQADTFVKTPSSASTTNRSNVSAIAWALDGQSYFASGNVLTNYSTCNDQNPQDLGAGPVNLSSTAIDGTPRVFGLGAAGWLDYSVTSSSQAGATVPVGNVCQSTVTVAPTTPNAVASTLGCTPQQFSFSPRLEQEFVTGVNYDCTATDPLIHGYDLSSHSEVTLSTLTPSNPIVPLSGGILNDGRELYIGTWDAAAQTAALHRFNLLTVAGSTTTPGTRTEDTDPVSLPLVPQFVAVVPK